MEYANLGSSGLRVSRVCLGMLSLANESDRPWVLNENAAGPLVRQAVEAGVNFFDTANSYSNGHSEIATGRLLRQFTNRDEVVVATKVFMKVDPGENGAGLSRRHIFKALDDSLRRLDMDYVDLYQIHRFDERVSVEETMGALNDVVRSGKVRYLGASSMYAWQFVKAQATARRAGGAQFISMQNHYNLIYREEEREMIPACRSFGVGVLPWSPLARGILAGNAVERAGEKSMRARFDNFPDGRYEHPSDAAIIAALSDIAARRGVPQARRTRLAPPPAGRHGAHLRRDEVPHVDDAVSALSFELSADQLLALEAPYGPHDIHGHE